MNYLLDTNIISYYFRGNTNIQAKILNIGLKNLFVSNITYFELVAGYTNSNSDYRDKSLKLLDEFMDLIQMVDLDRKSAKHSGQIKALLVKSGNVIEDTDLLIAGTAVANGLTLVTNNTKHFERIPNLKIQDWSK
jgi:predicted nucleic acid-binding protein